MRWILFVGVCSFSNTTSAQEWAPMGAKWHYKILSQGMCVLCTITNMTIEATGDTIINGQPCKILTKSRIGCIDFQEESYTYSDSGRVYWFNSVINDFTILYDFNAMPNDSWEIKIDTCTLTVTVDSIGLHSINGVSVRKLFISDSHGSYSGFFTGTIVETIGNLRYLFPDDAFTGLCRNYVCDGEIIYGLSCYEDSIVGLYETGISSSCDTTYSFLSTNTTDMHKETKAFVSISPNPATDFLHFQLPENLSGKIEIYNSSGSLMLQQEQFFEKDLRVRVKDFPSGLYFYRVNFENGGMVRGKFVKE